MGPSALGLGAFDVASLRPVALEASPRSPLECGRSSRPLPLRSQLFSALPRATRQAQRHGTGGQLVPAPERAAAPKATRGRKRGGAEGPPPEDDEDAKYRRKQEQLRDLIKQINDELGEGTVTCMDGPSPGIETFSSGVLPLDVALGGGWPRGRIVEVYGHESSGKTSLALHAIAEVQKQRQTAVIIDAEHAMHMEYARQLGVKTEGQEGLIVVQPNSGEHAIDVAEYFLRSGLISLIVIDSVSALVPQAELEAATGEGALGSLARLMSASLRKLAVLSSKSNCTVMFLNQIRNKIGAYGNPETTSGGVALKFHASARCEVKAVERKKIAGEDVGYRCRVRVVKNKVATPYKTAEFDFLHGRGVQHHAALLETAEHVGVVAKKGSYYYLAGQVMQGKEKAATFLKENPDFYAELDKAVRDALSGVATEVVAGEVQENQDSEDESFSDSFDDEPVSGA